MQMATKKSIKMKVGRDAKNGEFIPVAVAKRRHDTAVVETIRRPEKRKAK